MSLAAKRHLSRVAALGCVICRRLGMSDTPAEIHHPRFAAGMAQRASDWLAKCDEPALLADVIELLSKERT